MPKARISIHILLFTFILAAGLMSMSTNSPVRHPCHPGSPGGPGVGPPCPPTQVPDSTSADESDGEGDGGSGDGPVRFEVTNDSATQITVWLGDPVEYVFNVPAETVSTFVVPRDVYSYELAACGARSTGYLNLTLHSYLLVDPCSVVKLVRAEIVGDSDLLLVARLTGAGNYVIPVGAGEVRAVTIARGDYQLEIDGCGTPAGGALNVHSGDQVVLGCP